MSETDVQLETRRSETPKKPAGRGWRTFILICGVLVPAASILVELFLRICSSMFYDPIPTPVHLVLLALAPVANLIVFVMLGRPRSGFSAPVVFLVGMAIGTWGFYSALFLPILPFSLLGVMALGIGLCGLSPYFGLWASVVCSQRLSELPTSDRRHGGLIWSGGIVSGLVLTAFIAGTFVTSYGLKLAESNNPTTSQRGVKLIRRFGSESTLLRACYGLPTSVSGDFWTGATSRRMSPSRDKARVTFYRVTGRSFNSVPPPELIGFRRDWVSDFNWDSDVGGTAVNGRVTDLNLSSSRVDAMVDPNGLAAYTEWTMQFTNQSSSNREARTEIALPPGGVVSRVTLWVNGEEREAAFGSRGRVRQAYQEVAVVQQRDPVLVTTCGPDRVLVQCFPVPPNGGVMKVRIGITSPLTPQDDMRATFVLPQFVERNFGMLDGVKHSLFIESPQDMSFDGQQTTAITKSITDRDLAGAKGAITCVRDPGAARVWTPDKLDPKHYAIVQELVRERPSVPGNVVIVIDGSMRLADMRNDIADALGSLPGTCRFSVIQAGDEVNELTPLAPASPDAIQTAQEKIRALRFVGGIDNRPALLKACELAINVRNTAIVWIHGPQPLTTNAYAEQMNQIWEHRPGRIRIHAVPAVDGRNSILADLEQTGAVSVVPRSGALADDLKRLFGRWKDGSEGTPTVRRSRVPLSAAVDAVRVSSHVCRLWARDQVARMCALVDGSKLTEAADMASAYQLVTPVSGAVVLETQEQYKQNGLKAVDPKSVPKVVPEPASWIALAMGMAMLGTRLRRKQPQPASEQQV